MRMVEEKVIRGCVRGQNVMEMTICGHNGSTLEGNECGREGPEWVFRLTVDFSALLILTMNFNILSYATECDNLTGSSHPLPRCVKPRETWADGLMLSACVCVCINDDESGELPMYIRNK